jgi:hypothetical protein
MRLSLLGTVAVALLPCALGSMHNTPVLSRGVPTGKEDMVDLLVATFVRPDAAEVERQRTLINYQLQQVSNSINHTFNFQHVFVVCKGAPLQADDVVHVDCHESYDKLYEKTHGFWTSITSIVPARYYAKRDVDTFVCWRALVGRFRENDRRQTPLYMGAYTYDGKIYGDADHRWFDVFVAEMAPGQQQYWPYMQGAFYAMSGDLAATLAEDKGRLQMFAPEDVMVGAWLLSLRKRIYRLRITQDCDCGLADKVIFHKCPADTPRNCSNPAYVQNCL